MKKWMIVLAFGCSKLGAQQISTDTFWLSNIPVTLQKTQFGESSKAVFLHLHANETASVLAVTEYLQQRNGLLAALQHDTTRLVTFYLPERIIRFDPNRMFTSKGRMANLKLLNGNTPPAAEKIIGALADSIVSRLNKPKIIIAMHNNTDGRPLSVKSFKNIYVNPEMDTDDFILTTEKPIFDQLKKKRVNAVLQTQKTSTDDGSLAIFCSKKKIPYINIEAQEDHVQEQVRMLEALSGIIDQYTR